MTKDKKVSMKEKFLQDVLLEGYATCITSDAGCRGGKFYKKENAIKYLLSLKSTHFFTPGQFVENESRRLQDRVQAINCIWLDYDGNQKVNLEFFEKRNLPIPSYTLQRKDHYHIYYILENPYLFTDKENIKEFCHFFKKLAMLAGSDTSTVTTVQSYIRVPETLWQKHNVTEQGYEFLDELSSFKKFNVNDFFRFVEENYNEKDFVVSKGKKELAHLVTKTDESLESIKKLLFANQVIINRGEGRSKALYNLGCRCWDFGLSLENALEVVNDFNNLFCNPPENYEIVCHNLESAYRYAQGEFGSILENEGKELVQELYVRKKLADSLKDWYYVLESEQLRNPKNGKCYTTQGQIKNALASITGLCHMLNRIIAKNCIQVVDRVNFHPGESKAVIEKEYYREINSFVPLKKINTSLTDEESGKVFLNHLRFLTTSEAEFQHVVKWIRHIFLKPEKKIKHSLLFITEEGTGKTILTKFFEKVLCSINDLSYVTSLSSKEIIDGHNSKLDSKLLCITNELEGLITYSSQKDFKSWITDDTINIGNKYMRGYATGNFCNFISFSNSDNAAFIKKGDRRFFVIHNRNKPNDASYYKKLFYILENKYAEIYNYLIEYPLEELDEHAPPPMTSGKELVQEISKPELTKTLEELFESGKLEEALGNFFTSKQFIDTVSILLPFGTNKNLTYNKVHYFCQYKEITLYTEDFTKDDRRYRLKYFSISGKKMSKEEIIKMNDSG